MFFIVEKPPRVDPLVKDPNGVLNKCNISSNGLFPSLITPLEKVHYVPLPSLHNLPDKSKRNLFTDGIHLKPWGIKLLSNDIIAGVRSVYTDTVFQRDGKKDDPSSNLNNRKMFQQDGGQKGFTDRKPRRSSESESNHFVGNQPSGRYGQIEEPYRREGYQSQQDPSYRKWDDRRNSGDFQPGGSRRNQRRASNQEHFHPDGRRRNMQEDFHPAGGRGMGRENFHPAGRMPQENFHPSGRMGLNDFHPTGRRGNGLEFQPGGRNRNGTDRDNRGHFNITDRGQQDGMPDMVKEYLLKTLMGEPNRRY